MHFQAHLDLLRFFLAHRDEIVEQIHGLLNAQRKPIEYLQDGVGLSRDVEDCFFTLAALAGAQSRLRGELEAAHWASGFRPRALPGLHNGLADPGEMMTRGFHLWRQTRWPGGNGRLRYAHTLFNLYLLRCLELLSLRLWDDGADGAGDRLAWLQGLLDQLWATTPADQPTFVRDARWLIPLAQSPATNDLSPYFDVARKVAESLSNEDRIEIHKAGVRLAAGHLRSQIRYYSAQKGVALDEDGLLLNTRNTNALDFALLVQDLVPLLAAYEDACHQGDAQTRLELADTILQGMSPDPELFLHRVELLGAYSMIEHLFITTDDDGHAAYTPMGRRHVQLIHEYEARIGRVSKPLHDDCPHFRPAVGAYSPYGLLYGFATNLVEHMALKASHSETVSRFSLEDVFAAGGADTLAWVSGWRKLPHLTREVQAQFDYPQRFAEDVFNRLEQTLSRRASEPLAGAHIGRLFISDGNDRIPDLPIRYIASSDRELVAAHKAEYRDEPQLSSDRREGRCVLSYETPGGWVVISKAVLSEVVGAGRDVTIGGLPPAAAEALKLMYPRAET